VTEDPIAQVELDAEAHGAGGDSAGDGKPEAQKSQSGHRQDQRNQDVAVAAPQHVVDHAAGEVWQGDGARHESQGRAERQGDATAVRAEEAEKAEKDAHGVEVVYW
jgi:hypothetical protein